MLLGKGTPARSDSPAPPGFMRCGGAPCGKGYVCCVGATSSNHGVETCRPSSSGCKSGWAAERIKITD